MSFFLLLFLHVHCDIPLLTVWLQIPYICIWPYHWIAIEYLLKPFPSIKVWKNQKYVKKKSTERLKTCFVKQKKGPKSAAAAFTALGWLFDFFTQGIYFSSTFRLFASCHFQNLKSSKSGQKVQKADWHICWWKCPNLRLIGQMSMPSSMKECSDISGRMYTRRSYEDIWFRCSAAVRGRSIADRVRSEAVTT